MKFTVVKRPSMDVNSPRSSVGVSFSVGDQHENGMFHEPDTTSETADNLIDRAVTDFLRSAPKPPSYSDALSLYSDSHPSRETVSVDEPPSTEPAPPTRAYRAQSFHVVTVADFQPTENHEEKQLHPDENYMASLARQGRLYAARQTSRLVQKGGECNVVSIGVTQRNRKYLADMFTTLVEMRWRYHVFFFTTQFLITWCIFGAIYYSIAIVRGDIDQRNNSSWVPCIMNVYDYSSALMYSVETQVTIGYGVRVIDPSCRFGMFVVMLQSCLGTFVQVLATGLVFAKISRPKGRAKTLLFSRSAVICQRDGQFQLMFRVGDMRTKFHIIGTSIRALMVRNRVTAEGELIPMCQYPLALDNETSPIDDNYLLMVWPVTVVHKIDETSPLWDISADQLIGEQFEIIVILEGTIESTGSSTQVRTSYLPSEIRWGERLAPLVTHKKENGLYLIDYSRFHDTLPISMPECSAKTWLSRRLDIASDQTTTTDEIRGDFTAAALAPATSASRIIRKIFHRISTVDNPLKHLEQAKKSHKPEPESSYVWTVADPLRPTSTLAKRPSQPFLDLKVNNNRKV